MGNACMAAHGCPKIHCLQCRLVRYRWNLSAHWLRTVKCMPKTIAVCNSKTQTVCPITYRTAVSCKPELPAEVMKVKQWRPRPIFTEYKEYYEPITPWWRKFTAKNIDGDFWLKLTWRQKSACYIYVYKRTFHVDLSWIGRVNFAKTRTKLEVDIVKGLVPLLFPV